MAYLTPFPRHCPPRFPSFLVLARLHPTSFPGQGGQGGGVRTRGWIGHRTADSIWGYQHHHHHSSTKRKKGGMNEQKGTGKRPLT